MGLLHRTNTIRLATAARLAGAYMMAITSAVSRKDVRESRPIAVLINIDAIADRRPILLRISKNASDSSACNVNDVVNWTATIGEPGDVTRKESQSLLFCNRRRGNPGVQAQQVSNRPAVLSTATRTDRGRVHDQGKQIGTRSRRNWDFQDRRKQVRQQWIKKEAGELLVVFWIGDAEEVLRSSPDD